MASVSTSDLKPLIDLLHCIIYAAADRSHVPCQTIGNAVDHVCCELMELVYEAEKKEEQATAADNLNNLYLLNAETLNFDED